MKTKGLDTQQVSALPEVYKAIDLCTIPCSRKPSIPNTIMAQLPKNHFTSLIGLLAVQDQKDKGSRYRVFGNASQNWDSPMSHS